MDTHSQEIEDLRRCVRDLVALSTVPAVWIGQDLPHIAEGLADVLVSALRPEIVYVCLKSSAGEIAIEVARAPQRADIATRASEIGRVLAPWLNPNACDLPASIPNPIGSGKLLLTSAPIGHGAELGILVAGSRQVDFPTQSDRLLLTVAANQAAIALARRRAEEAARASEARLLTTLRSIGDGVIATDAAGRVSFLNPVAEALTGWQQQEAEGRCLAEVFRIVHEQTRQPVANPVAEVIEQGGITSPANPTVLIARDGTERPIDDSAAPIRDAAGSLVGVVLVFRDITEPRRAEALRFQLAAIVESSADGIIGKDLDGIITSWNAGAERLYGYTATEVVGKPIGLLIPPDREDELPAIMRRLRRGERIEHYETVRRRKDGRLVNVSVTISPVRDTVGQIVGASAVARDITERRRAEEALRENERRFREMIDALPAAIYTTDADGRLTHFNPAAVEFSGRVPELGSDHWCVTWKLHYPDGRPMPHDECPMAVALKEGRAVRGTESIAERPDGTRIWFEPYPTPLRDSEGRIVGGINMLVDITRRKQAEEKLRRSEQELADFFENATVGLHWVGPGGIILRANRAELDLLGYAPDEYIGHHIAEFHVDKDVIEDILRRLQAGEGLHEYEARLRCKDGSIRQVLINSNVLWEDGQFIHTRCFTHDVTDRKQAEALLQYQKEALEMTARQVPLRDVLDFLARAVESQSHEGLMAAIHLLNPAGTHFASAAAPSLPAGYLQATEGLAVESRSGPCCDAVLSGEPVTAPDVAHDPRWPRFAELALSCGIHAGWSTPILSSQGKVVGTFANYYREPREPRPQDQQLLEIMTRTVALAIEHKRADEELQEADRRKDEFLAMLAHELRNPLAPIRNAVYLLKQLEPNEPRLARARATIERQVNQQTRLLEDLLDVSRISRGKITLRPERLDLARLVHDTAEDLRAEMDAVGLTFSVELPEEPVWVEGDPTRLAQCVGNLLVNAAKFTERGGEVTVRLAVGADGQRAAITVRDTGIGIEPEMLRRVFETFAQADRSLHRGPGGLGLGLALVKAFIELHGGEVRAESAGIGRGAEFTLLLPLASAPGAAEQASGPLRICAKAKRILIVEDNQDAAETLREVLELFGCTVQVAPSGREAVEAARQFLPELVLCDLGLPGMDGYEVATALRQDPATSTARLVAVSGYGQEEDQRRSRTAGFEFHLTKPVDLEALQRLLEVGEPRLGGGAVSGGAGPGSQSIETCSRAPGVSLLDLKHSPYAERITVGSSDTSPSRK